MSSTVQKKLKILIVEDEAFIADVCRKVLEAEGHSVRTAADGQEGIAIYKDSVELEDAFDLVITDYRMPRKDGAQLIKEIFAIRPNQKIILATAYGTEYVEVAFPADRVPVLAKPFGFDDLTAMVQKQAAL